MQDYLIFIGFKFSLSLCSRTCLTNHMGFISHHIMPLVINSLQKIHNWVKNCENHGSFAIYGNYFNSMYVKVIKFLNQVHTGLWPAHTRFLKIAFVQKVCMRVCSCVHPPTNFSSCSIICELFNGQYEAYKHATAKVFPLEIFAVYSKLCHRNTNPRNHLKLPEPQKFKPW